VRKVIFAINTALDGCCDHTKGIPPDDELYPYYTNLVREVGLLAYGRKTYELMVPYWPDIAKNHSGDSQGENDFAQAFDAVEKMVVFSRTLEKVERPNAKIVRADPQAEILRLKQEEGKSILLGGVNIPSQLIEHDLVDEYRIVVLPIFAGEGPRLLKGVSLPEIRQLKLVDSKTFKSGCVALRYVRP
jgi:dihydrofolate reductase